MVYGLVSERDDEKTRLMFLGKQIPLQNVVCGLQLGELMKSLNKGDTVYVVSVNRFPSVNSLKVFGSVCIQKGVSLQIMEQPFLNISKGKVWGYTTLWQLERMNEIENFAKAYLQKNFKMNTQSWEVVYRCLEVFNLEVCAHTFSADGILKK